jgi:hypothetical protein
MTTAAPTGTSASSMGEGVVGRVSSIDADVRGAGSSSGNGVDGTAVSAVGSGLGVSSGVTSGVAAVGCLPPTSLARRSLSCAWSRLELLSD